MIIMTHLSYRNYLVYLMYLMLLAHSLSGFELHIFKSQPWGIKEIIFLAKYYLHIISLSNGKIPKPWNTQAFYVAHCISSYITLILINFCVHKEWHQFIDSLYEYQLKTSSVGMSENNATCAVSYFSASGRNQKPTDEDYCQAKAPIAHQHRLLYF